MKHYVMHQACVHFEEQNTKIASALHIFEYFGFKNK